MGYFWGQSAVVFMLLLGSSAAPLHSLMASKSPLNQTTSPTSTLLPTASKPEHKGPHGGIVVNRAGRDFEIKIDKLNQMLHVYTPSNQEPQPQNMGVTLYQDKNTGQTIHLRTIGPPTDGYYHYQGQLDPSQSSSVAFGLQFDLEPNTHD